MALGETWFTANLRLGDEAAAGRRGFDSLAEHDETIIQGWNGVVGRDDVVFVLGDVAALGCGGDDDGSGDGLEPVTELRGHKYLVCGQTDRPFAGYPGQTPELMATWRRYYLTEGGFDGVNTWQHVTRSGRATPHVLRGSMHLPRMVLTSPFPVNQGTGQDGGADSDPLACWRPRLPRGAWLVHGGVHPAPGAVISEVASEQRFRGQQINVGVDAWDWAPVNSAILLSLITKGGR
jgi:calcineurin-like phosphoesterase family protein